MDYQRPGVPMRPMPSGGGLVPRPGLFPHPQPHGFGHPMMMMPPIGQPVGHPGFMSQVIPPIAVPTGIPATMTIQPPKLVTPESVKVPVPSSMANMKVATTVFVGNISEKASDTLIRQIILRCGAIEGWKRVQDASGKLQGFGFCEYADPDSTLRALRLLHNLKLGDKPLVAKVDAKTRKELLKYILTKKLSKKNEAVNETEVEKEVEKLEEDKDIATAALISEVPEEAKSEDTTIMNSITHLLKGYLAVLSSSKTNEDIQRERDVKESILFMAKQSGSLDPDSTLEDMDMEDDMKTLVSDEIKRFRESYKRSDEARKEKKTRDDVVDRGRSRPRDGNKVSTLKDVDPLDDRTSKDSSPSPTTKPSSSPRRRSRSPMRSRSQERAEREKKREAVRHKEREILMKEDEDYEERMRQRKVKDREKIYRMHLSKWEERERRKEKEHEKELKREKERREEMVKERKHLGDFLSDYDDEKLDQKYYRGSAFNRRYHDRELEVESDERDRLREKDELEELRLQVIERQARELLSESRSSEEESASRDNDEDDRDVPMTELEEDIPLAKTGYSVPPAYPPIQVHSAPLVDAPERKPGFVPALENLPSQSSATSSHPREEEIKRDQSEGASPASLNSPSQPKLMFGLKKSGQNSNSQTPTAVTVSQSKAKMESIFTAEEDDMEQKPKKKLVPIEYSDDEEEAEPVRDRSPHGKDRSPRSDHARSRRSSGRGSRDGRSEKGDRDVGIVKHYGGGKDGEGMLVLDEEMKNRKLTPDERKKLVQQLVNSIPTAKEEVFQYPLKWEEIDKVLIEKRVGPWINKKITEYIGEAEPILTEFVCNKLSCHISPSDILTDIRMVLDDEADVFIVKLWRLLIYETEAKHLGIAKNY